MVANAEVLRVWAPPVCEVEPPVGLAEPELPEREATLLVLPLEAAATEPELEPEAVGVAAAAPLIVGRAEKRSADWKVTQFEDAGTTAV